MRSARHIVIGVLLTLMVIAGLGTMKFFQIQKASAQHSKFAPPPEAVTSTHAALLEWRDTLTAVGSLAASQGTTISSEEAGKVVKIYFESGAAVEQRAPLLDMDTSVEEANLQGALARLEQARHDLGRAELLRKTNALPQSELDSAVAKARASESESTSLRATIARKKIVAPFAGHLGIRLVNEGQFLEKGAAIVPLYSLDPLYLNFTVPQKFVSVVKVNDPVEVQIDAFDDETFNGVVTSLNPQIDESSRTFSVQGTLPNRDHRLRPGMFARVAVLLPAVQRVIAIPSSSISYAPSGDMVFIVENMTGPDGKEYRGVRQQPVKLGQTRGDLVAVTHGLKEGEEVVTSGVFKLRQGAAVNVNNSFSPGDSVTPTVADT